MPSATPLPTCLTCNYVLTGITTPRCPECGGDFDPADRSTFGPRESTLVRFARRCAALQPSLRFCGLLAVGLLLFVVIASPIWDGNLFIHLAIILMCFLGWLIGIITTSLAGVFLRVRGIRCGFPTWRWLLALFICMGSVYITVTNAPLRLAAALSHASLVRHATALEQSGTQPPRFIGLFHVRRARHDASTGITTIEVEPVFTPMPPPMAFRKGDANTVFGNMHFELPESWRLEWDNT
jgi:hypothetical protein